ncbi:GNAT family N-acetyltransferase [Roseateles sp. MS654]|uniref:GNAT family N-acetyltransferase n=1 Tax=Roseateles sp. MS654 TaxID=3412685 RepID=UPI003C2D589F
MEDTNSCVNFVEFSVRQAAERDVAAFLKYSIENRCHLAPWDPLREDSYYEAQNFASMFALQLRDCSEGRAKRFFVFDAREEIVAAISCTNIVFGPFQACNLGYSIAASLEGNGIMHLALDSILHHMLGVVGLNRIMANYMPHNVRSGKLLRRLGFSVEGYAVEYLKIAGVWEDHVLSSITASRFKERLMVRESARPTAIDIQMEPGELSRWKQPLRIAG